MLTGQCLCGAVAFAIDGKTTDIYQCHCSVCRKATGSSNVSLFLCRGKYFRWVAGEQHIKLFKTPTGYRSVFCHACGSHLPDPNPDKTTYWIPAGLMDDNGLKIKVGAHVFVGSKAKWHDIGGNGIQFQESFPAD